MFTGVLCVVLALASAFAGAGALFFLMTRNARKTTGHADD